MQTRRSYPLHVHLWLLFGGLVLTVGALICSINFMMTRTALEAAAADATHQISRETLDEVEELVIPAQMAVKMVSHSSLADARTFDQRLARLALVCDALESSPVLQSLYLGYDDGSFFYVRPLRNQADRSNFHAPKQASYVIRSIEPVNGSMQGRHYFIDGNLKTVGVDEAADIAARFDPRQRPWYITAMATGSHIRTEPYMLFSEQVAGATLAVPTANRHAVVGGDIRLDSLGNMLTRKRTTARSVLALLDASGQVIAIDSTLPASRSAPDAIRTELLASAGDYGIPVLTRLADDIRASRHVSGQQGAMSAGGEAWYTTVDALTPSGGKPLFLVSAIPEDELLRGAREQAWTGMGATAIVILLAIPLIWLAGRYLSQPLHTLADGVEAIRRFDFLQPIAVRSSIREINALGVATEAMRQTIQRFLTISKAVSGEARLDHLLPLLLRKTLNAAGGNAGVLYLVDGNELAAAAAIDRNGADAAHAAPTTSFEQALPLLRAAAGELVAQAGYLMPDEIGEAGLGALTSGQPYHAAAIPLATHQHELQGIILVLRDTPMEAAQLGFVSTLASLFAGALEVLELTKGQRDLFDAFIRLLAGAIDAKSPHTGGHCERVPELAKMLAKAACDATSGPYKSFQMTDAQWEALHVAAWLHDCGKVTTPEYIIDKGTKLETLYDRIHEIRMRFEVLKRDAEIACLQSIAAGENEVTARDRRDAELKALDDDFAVIAACNRGGEFVDAELKARVLRIASRTWLRTLNDRLGISQDEQARKARSPAATLPTLEPLLADKPEHVIERTEHATIAEDNPWGFKLNTPRHLYNRGELHNLLIAKGTLSGEERFKIEDHIVQTQIMLSRLPFPKHLREVPEIAGSHHEKMDGTGYPRRLSREQMSPLARMMAIADVFEALTAADRPYKKAMTLSESVRIMSIAKTQHHIDPELFDLFLTSEVYLRYAERYMRPDQIDAVDVEQYVGTQAADQQGPSTTAAQ
jgi:HD-GYP domain-containing protein (c-di-GMP phosphodiesterase class II)